MLGLKPADSHALINPGQVSIAKAIKEAGKIKEVTVVSMDGIKAILDAIQEGIIESSSSSKPRMQGSMSILLLWQASLGMQIIVDRLFKTVLAIGLSYVPSTGRSKHDRTKETQGAFG